MAANSVTHKAVQPDIAGRLVLLSLRPKGSVGRLQASAGKSADARSEPLIKCCSTTFRSECCRYQETRYHVSCFFVECTIGSCSGTFTRSWCAKVSHRLRARSHTAEGACSARYMLLSLQGTGWSPGHPQATPGLPASCAAGTIPPAS